MLLPEYSVTSLDVIHHADALTWFRAARWLVRDGSMPRYHAVFADPPYGLAFMAQKWDTMKPREFQAWVAEWAALLLDVVYPGALLMMFGGTRTYHRLACGLEDAGWEIVDSLMWVYGSGFPKSHDISKALDREAGAAREVVGEYAWPDGKPRNTEAHTTKRNGIYSDIKQAGTNDRTITAPATPDAERWQGYGTALKPAYEPIILARAPRGARTYAALAREFGTGALNVDGGRIEATDKAKFPAGIVSATESTFGNGRGLYDDRPRPEDAHPAGRWPANVILDEHAAAALDEMSGNMRAGKPSGTGRTPGVGPNSWFTTGEETRAHYDDEDISGASRFFYTAKAAAWEREAGLRDRPQTTVTDGRKTPIDNPYQRAETKRRNVHPTVKPIQLTEYLARLLLPPELDEPRRLLVPFAGVGSEIIGARLAGWDIITGIEQGAEYVALARPRIAWWAQFSSYEQARAAYQADRDDEARVEAERAAGVEQIALFDVA